MSFCAWNFQDFGYLEKFYQQVGLNLPRMIAWCDTPLDVILAHHLIRDDFLTGYTRDCAWRILGELVGDCARGVIRSSIKFEVMQKVWHEIGKLGEFEQSVKESVWETIWSLVEAYVTEVASFLEATLEGATAGRSVKELVGEIPHYPVRHQAGELLQIPEEISLPSYCSGYHRAILVEETNKLNKLYGILMDSLSGFWATPTRLYWWVPCKDLCFISKPSLMKFLDQD